MGERETTIVVEGQEKKVIIVDNGENFKNGDGRIPNHDKVEIVYRDDGRQNKEIVPNT